jgi:FixJ family two-component response regulator
VARAALELYELTGVAGPSLRHPTRPDAMVLDATGAWWSSLDMLEILTSEREPLPTIVLAREGDAAAFDRARRLGAAAVLELPVDEELVRAEVASLVAPVCRGATS